MASDWITTEEAAQLSGYHPEYIRELIRAKKIKAQKFAVVWQVSRKSLLSYVKMAARSEDGRYQPKGHWHSKTILI